MNKKICVLMLIGILTLMTFQTIPAEVTKPDAPVSTDKEASPIGEKYEISFITNYLKVSIWLVNEYYTYWLKPAEVNYVEAGIYSLFPAIHKREFGYWKGIPSYNIDISDKNAESTYVTISGPGTIFLWTEKKDDVNMRTTQVNQQQFESIFLGSQSL